MSYTSQSCSNCQTQSKAIPKFSCKGCNRLLCMNCSGLSRREMHVFQLPAPKMIYLCDPCHQDFRQVGELRNIVRDLEKQVQILKDTKTN